MILNFDFVIPAFLALELMDFSTENFSILFLGHTR